MPTTYRYTTFISLLPIVAWLAGCSGTGPEIIDPGAEDRTQTALVAVAGDQASNIARYYEPEGLVEGREYEAANGVPLDLTVDAMYERDDQVWLNDDSAGTIAVLDLNTREEIGRIEGFPTGDDGHLNGMAFSNLSQAWAIAYGSGEMFHIDARNHVKVRDIALPGEPTGIATVDNRVLIGLQRPDGTGSIGLMHSNDPEFEVDEIVDLERPPVVVSVTPDDEFLALILPGDSVDNAETPFIDTDPRLVIVDLLNYSIQFDDRFIGPPLLGYVGQQPTFSSSTLDFFIYLATKDGLLRVDTKAWGQVTPLLADQGYSVVGSDYWTDLVYAVPTSDLTRIERVDKKENRLDPVQFSGTVRAIQFVSSNTVSR
jgi:hypothetical protein